MNRQIFSEKTIANVKTGKFDGNNREMCGREQKSKNDQTL